MKKRKSLVLGLVGLTLIGTNYSFADSNSEVNDLSNSVVLDENNNDYVLLNKSDNDYVILNTKTNEKISYVSETINGISVKLSAYEALDRFNNIQPVDDNINESVDLNEIQSPEIKSTKSFQRIGQPTKVTGSEKSLSHDVKGPASISVGAGLTATISNTFSVTDATEQRAIKASAGFTWSTSASRTLTTVYPVPSGKMHTVMTSGVISATKNAHGDSPMKISTGMCDGLEYLATR